jgi:hypothetical protein
MDQQIQVKADDQVLKGSYSNNMQVSHTKEEFVLDFFNILPPAGQLVSRVITNPAHFKRMLQALETNLKNYEQAFGAIPEDDTSSEKKIGFKTA